MLLSVFDLIRQIRRKIDLMSAKLFWAHSVHANQHIVIVLFGNHPLVA
jgi:hypothetical protein